MKENTLLKIALICSLAGLLALYFVSNFSEIKEYSPILDAGDDVFLKGEVEKVSERDGVVFITINFDAKAEIVLFTKDSIDLKENDIVEVTGKIDEYRGKKEIIAQKIKVER